MMHHEKSCGAVVFTVVNGERKYLITCNKKGKYGFPKGHVEPGETDEHETATREIWEETRLKVTFIDGFRRAWTAILPEKENTDKEEVYFIATYTGQEPYYQREELAEAKLRGYEEALSLLQVAERKQLLMEADAFLNEAGTGMR